jgi:integrase
VAQERKGSIRKRDGKLYARVQFIDENGRKRELWRRAESRTHARKLIRELLSEVESSSAEMLNAAQLTFDELADYFEKTYLKPAVYVDGRKVAGVRSVIPAKIAVQALRMYFGSKRVRSITYGDIRTFKNLRLQTKTMHGNQRSIAAVNRELDKLRRIFNVAIQQGWLDKSPFHKGDSLISLADEKHRERILTREEEARLLSAIDAEPLRAHLKGVLLLALDCALRRGEILTLAWSDIDLERRTITVRAFNAKTARARTVAMTTRVHLEMQRICEGAGEDSNQLVFRGIKSVRTSFAKACKEAKVQDFRLHDCRHTAITRMIRVGLPPVEVMRVSGHTTMSAFYRYANLDADTVFKAAAALDAFHAQSTEVLSTNIPEFLN